MSNQVCGFSEGIACGGTPACDRSFHKTARRGKSVIRTYRQVLLCLGVLLMAANAQDAVPGQQDPATVPQPGQPVAPTLPIVPDPAAPAAAPQGATPAIPSSADPLAESPGEIYKAAMHPLEVVRGSMENWSDSELGALAVGMHKARESCEQMKAEGFSGDQLYDLAKLCSFGQDWNDANSAAVRYMDSRAEPHRAQAFALSINALVHLNGVDLAIQSSQVLLESMPYDAEVAYAIRYMKDYLEQAGNLMARKLAEDEHEKIVHALRQGTALKAIYGDAVMGYGLLYDSAMELAFLERFAGMDEEAAATAADCDDAVRGATALTAEDRQRIDSVRLQFRLLGTKLPEVPVTRSLISAQAKAQLPAGFGEGTVLVVFPDWCAQCRTMMKTLTEFGKVNATTPLHAYGLVFHEEGETQGQAPHPPTFKDLQGTATFVVPQTTAQTFGVLDYPTAVVVDGHGVIRFIGLLPADAFNGDGYVSKVIQRMVAAAHARRGSQPRGRSGCPAGASAANQCI